MAFDWKEESKERYYRKAEKLIKVAGFEDFLQVDRSQFGVVGKKTIKVYVKPVRRNGNLKKWWEVKRTIPDFKELEATKNMHGKRDKMIFLYGYFEIEMEEQDK